MRGEIQRTNVEHEAAGDPNHRQDHHRDDPDADAESSQRSAKWSLPRRSHVVAKAGQGVS
jgi:hypothetical protein